MTDYNKGLLAGQEGIKEFRSEYQKLKNKLLDDAEVLTNTICDLEDKNTILSNKLQSIELVLKSTLSTLLLLSKAGVFDNNLLDLKVIKSMINRIKNEIRT